MSDVRLAVRMLAKSPAFTLVAIASPAGAAALIFRAVDAILWPGFFEAPGARIEPAAALRPES